MTTDVEIIWPEALPRGLLTAATDELDSVGLEASCRIQPVRRGAESAVLILLTTTMLEPFLKAMFERFGSEASAALKRFVGAMFGSDDTEEQTGRQRPDVVIFESTTTGAQFLFTAGLPQEAMQQAVELDPGTAPGRWTWATQERRWLKFEDVGQPGATRGST